MPQAAEGDQLEGGQLEGDQLRIWMPTLIRKIRAKAKWYLLLSELDSSNRSPLFGSADVARDVVDDEVVRLPQSSNH